MSPDRYDAFDDPYCYPGTQCLRNKLDIRDAARLEAFELEMSTLRATEPLPTGRFSPAHYRNLHRHLFQDVYAWAGQYRSVRTSKGGNVFCYPEHISSEMRKLFTQLKAAAFRPNDDLHGFISSAATFLGELNAIHPFREGNGRVQLTFLHLLGLRAGHPFDLARVRNESFMPAMIASFHGDSRPLTIELRRLIDLPE